MENKFITRRCSLQVESVYQFEQYGNNENLLRSQFIPEDSMDEYLEEYGIRREEILVEE